MLAKLRNFIDGLAPGESRDAAVQDGLDVITAALLLEVARADFDTQPEEFALIEALIGERFDLDAHALAERLDTARRRVDASVSLHDFTRALNEGLDERGKRRLLVMLWQVAHADGRIDKHEEHLLRRVADLLHLPHSEFIRAKFEAVDG